MTKIFNFALKIKWGVVRRVAHAKSSDPAIPQKFRTCTLLMERQMRDKCNFLHYPRLTSGRRKITFIIQLISI